MSSISLSDPLILLFLLGVVMLVVQECLDMWSDREVPKQIKEVSNAEKVQNAPEPYVWLDVDHEIRKSLRS